MYFFPKDILKSFIKPVLPTTPYALEGGTSSLMYPWGPERERVCLRSHSNGMPEPSLCLPSSHFSPHATFKQGNDHGAQEKPRWAALQAPAAEHWRILGKGTDLYVGKSDSRACAFNTVPWRRLQKAVLDTEGR